MNDLQRYLVEEELEHYRDGWISRREFMRRAVLVGAAAGVAGAMAAGINPLPLRQAGATQQSPFHVPEDDPAVRTEWVWFTAEDGTTLLAYVAWPAEAMDGRSLPAVAVWDANRTLNDYALDVARRFAVQGYVAIAPDLLSRTGRTSSDLTDDEARTAFASLAEDRMALDMAAALEFLRDNPFVEPSKLAAIGFCAGGAIVWRLATLYPDLRAAAPFYGDHPPLDDVPNIQAAIFGVYGELDERINRGIPAIEAAMQEAGTTYRIKVYPASRHAFHRDTSPTSYNPETAVEAWIDTLNWFAEHLDLPAPRL